MSRKVLLLALGFFVTQTSWGQEATTDAWSRKITLTARAQSLANLVPMLASETGLPLDVAPTVQNLIVLVHAKDLPAKAVLDNLAVAIRGEWVNNGGRIYLQRESGFTKKMQQVAIAQDEIAIAKVLEKRMAELRKKPTFTASEGAAIAKAYQDLKSRSNPESFDYASYSRAQGLSERTPTSRALTRLLNQLSPKAIASIEPRTKAVFSSRPTNMQYALDPKAMNALALFVKEQAVWVEASAELGDPDDEMGMGFAYPVAQTRKEIKGMPAKVLLTLTRYSQGLNFQVELLTYDERGKLLSQASSSLDDSGGMEEPMLNPPKPDPKAPKITLGPEAKEMFISMMARGQPGQKVEISAGLRQKLLSPETYDPLSFGASDMLVGYADFEKKNLFAQLSDELMFIGFGQDAVEVPVSQVQMYLPMLMETVATDGTVVLRPKRVLDSEAQQTNRKALGAYLRTLVAQGKLTLDQKAEYAIRSGEQDYGLDQILPQLLTGTMMGEEYFDKEGLRLYGSLSSTQRAQAANGTLMAAALNGNQQNMIYKMVYGGNSWLNYTGDGSPDDELYYGGIYQQTTESLPNGVPRNALIKLDVKEEEVMMTPPVKMSQYEMPPRALTANEYAWHVFSTVERPDLFPGMGNQEYNNFNINELTKGMRKTVNLTIEFSPKLSLVKNFSETTKGGKSGLAQMSPEFQKEVETQLKGLRDAYKNRQQGDPDGDGGVLTFPFVIKRLVGPV